MRTQLNLAAPVRWGIEYDLIKYPDGQRDIVITSVDLDEEVQLVSRFNSFEDLGLIICATKALRRLGVKKIHLFIPYLLGARADRQFNHGGTSYLLDVIAPILNAQKYTTIQCMDVHNEVMALACIPALQSISNLSLIQHFIDDYTHVYKRDFNKDTVLVSPDNGSYKKLYDLMKASKYEGPTLICNKVRDKDGTILETTVPYESNNVGKDFIIVDDICDGGRTFIEIAKVLKGQIERHSTKRHEKSKIFLIVTHGIFSKGFKELVQYFDGVYCTNSVKDVLETEQVADNKDIETRCKQLDIFV